MGPQEKNKKKYDSISLWYDLIQLSQEGNKDQPSIQFYGMPSGMQKLTLMRHLPMHMKRAIDH